MSAELIIPDEQAVVNLTGGPRSGKGTEAIHWAKYFKNVTMFETGQDYRYITDSFTDLLDAGMSRQQVEEIIMHHAHLLPEIAAARPAFVTTHGTEALYTPKVAALVSKVAQVHEARQAVKGHLLDQIDDNQRSGAYDVVALDGRNLDAVVGDYYTIALDAFIDCTPWIATVRECLRSKIDINDVSNKDKVKGIFDAIVTRRHDDANRSEDKVAPKPSGQRLDFWAERRAGRSSQEIGEMAVEKGLQLFHDTSLYHNVKLLPGGEIDPSYSSLEAMLKDAREILGGVAAARGIKLIRA